MRCKVFEYQKNKMNMNKTYYSSILNQYLVGVDNCKDKNKCVEYSDGSFYNSMSEFYQSKITLLLWGSTPSNVMFDNVHLLDIEPPEECLYLKDIPSFIKDFKKLKVLSMPLIYALAIKDNSIPESVIQLSLINDLSQTDNLGVNKKERIQNLLFPNVTYPNIKSLHLITSSTATMQADGYLNLNESNFPNLEFLRCMSNHKDKYPLLKNFTNLKHLWVSVYKDTNIFDQIESPLISLNIDGAGSDFRIQEMVKLSSLEIIRINSCYNEFDCKELLKLPELKEIILLNSKKIKNVESLLDMPSLKSLDVLDCKGAFTKQQKVLFKNNIDRFERLSLDYT